MEALSVLQREVERLKERRERLTKGITRMLGSVAESAQRSRAAVEDRGRITKIRDKIRRIDWRTRLLEERVDRVRDEEGREDEESYAVLDELEGAVRRANRRIEMEQGMLERMRIELSSMRGEI
jgi:FtsZ-binding cell division protein ZapB